MGILLEKGFVVFSLLFFTGAITVLLNGGTAPNASQSDSISKVLMYGIQGITGLLLVADYKRVIQTALREKLLWIIVAIALFSTFWSDVPSRTIASNINLVRITLFGVYFAARYSLKEQLHLLTWVLGIAAALSLAFIIVLPSYGVMGMGSISSPETIAHAGTWQGVYGHKNILARIMLLSTIAFFLFSPSNRRHRWLVWGCYVLSIILIVGSTSKTALIIFMTVLALLPLYRALRWNYTLVVPFFITVILVSGGFSILLLGSAEDILAAFERDLTLTGRTDLWMAVLEKIGERPWLGYGYGGFWLGLNGESVDVWNAVLWQPPHSHNGFLDLWLDLGLLGLSVFAFSFIAVCLRSVAWLRQNHTSEGLWPLAYLTFLLLANLTESSLLRQNLLWILYVSITLSTYKNCENLAGAKAFLQQKVKKKSINKITPRVQKRIV